MSSMPNNPPSTSRKGNNLFSAAHPEANGGAVAFIKEHGRLPRPVDHKAFDPFRRKTIEISTCTRILLRVSSFVLVPLRVILILTTTLLSYALVKAFGPPVSETTVAHFRAPIVASWRRHLVVFANKFLGRLLLIAFGFWTVEGSDAEGYDEADAAKATIISNHSSLADPCLLAYLFAPSFVAKNHVYMIPGVGRIGAAQHAFYIDRMHGTNLSVTEKLAERQRLVAQADGLLPPVAIFPEGTTTNGEYLLRFRTGAFVAGTPIAPVLIRYSYRWFSPSYESIKTGPYILGLMSQPVLHVRYHRLPVYHPTEEEKSDASLYAANVYALMLSESENVFGTRWIASNSNLVDKIEYNSIVRGDKLRARLTLNEA